MNSAQLLPVIRDLYSRLPEMYYRQPWERQHVLFSLGHTDDLADEGEIWAAVEIARGGVSALLSAVVTAICIKYEERGLAWLWAAAYFSCALATAHWLGKLL